MFPPQTTTGNTVRKYKQPCSEFKTVINTLPTVCPQSAADDNFVDVGFPGEMLRTESVFFTATGGAVHLRVSCLGCVIKHCRHITVATVQLCSTSAV